MKLVISVIKGIGLIVLGAVVCASASVLAAPVLVLVVVVAAVHELLSGDG